MIKSTDDFRVQKVEGLMGGKGHVTFIHYYEPEDFAGAGRLFGKTLIEPGNSIGVHSHEGEQEAYYILKGKALYNDNGTEVEIGPGTLTLCKSGDSHGIEAIGDETLEYAMLITNTK